MNGKQKRKTTKKVRNRKMRKRKSVEKRGRETEKEMERNEKNDGG